LDVRDPLGTRCPDIEAMIETYNKEVAAGAPTESKASVAATAAAEFKFDFSLAGLSNGGVSSSSGASSLFPTLSGGAVAKKTVKPIIYILNKIGTLLTHQSPTDIRTYHNINWLHYTRVMASVIHCLHRPPSLAVFM
jgi:hypothetical protein